MSIFDRFKKRRERERDLREKKEKEREKKRELADRLRRERGEEAKPKAAAPEQTREAWRVLEAPHITEKATDLAENGVYVFRVYPGANKAEVAKAVEAVYGVTVTRVRVLNVPPKPKRLGAHEGRRPGYKKAVVEVAKGQEIELLPT